MTAAVHNHPAYQRFGSNKSGHPGPILYVYWPAQCPACRELEGAPLQPDEYPPTHNHNGPYAVPFAPVEGCGGCVREEPNADGTLGPFTAFEGEGIDLPTRIFTEVTWFDATTWIQWRRTEGDPVPAKEGDFVP